MRLQAHWDFSMLSTAQIAETTGVSQATIFKNKDQLLIHIFQEMTLLLQEEVLTTSLEKETLEDLVHFIVFDRFDLVETNSSLFRILIQEPPINPHIQTVGQNTFSNLFSELISHLRHLRNKDTSFNDQLSDATIARIFMDQ